jgi:hypothetical protein
LRQRRKHLSRHLQLDSRESVGEIIVNPDQIVTRLFGPALTEATVSRSLSASQAQAA